MSPDKYDRRVVRSLMRVLAEEEGKLRGAAMVRRASAGRVQEDLEASKDLPPEAREAALREVAESVGVAAAMDREAGRLRALAADVAGWVRKAEPAQPAKPSAPEPGIEDVVLTLEEAAKGIPAGSREAAKVAEIVAALKLPPDRIAWFRAADEIPGIPWPAGMAAALATRALGVLTTLASRMPYRETNEGTAPALPSS